jgi:hypothetical protein
MYSKIDKLAIKVFYFATDLGCYLIVGGVFSGRYLRYNLPVYLPQAGAIQVIIFKVS